MNQFVWENNLLHTLFVFSTHFSIIEFDAPSETITQQTSAMRKAIDNVKQLTMFLQVNYTLKIWNSPSIALLHNFLLNSNVLVFPESKGD